jgi:hypothetical protein
VAESDKQLTTFLTELLPFILLHQLSETGIPVDIVWSSLIAGKYVILSWSQLWFQGLPFFFPWGTLVTQHQNYVSRCSNPKFLERVTQTVYVAILVIMEELICCLLHSIGDFPSMSSLIFVNFQALKSGSSAMEKEAFISTWTLAKSKI